MKKRKPLKVNRLHGLLNLRDRIREIALWEATVGAVEGPLVMILESFSSWNIIAQHVRQTSAAALYTDTRLDAFPIRRHSASLIKNAANAASAEDPGAARVVLGGRTPDYSHYSTHAMRIVPCHI